jgi:hypothetical protein
MSLAEYISIDGLRGSANMLKRNVHVTGQISVVKVITWNPCSDGLE